MNLELLRTFDASYPEHNDGVLDSGSEALITHSSTDAVQCSLLVVMTGGLHSGTS